MLEDTYGIQSKDAGSENKKTIAVDWDAQEWFQVWLQLTRHSGQGRTDNPKATPKPEPASAS